MGMNNIWVCDLCEFTTLSYKDYRLHMEYTHNVLVLKNPNHGKPVKTIYAGYGEEQRRLFNEISFRNIVEFYEDELVQISQGMKPREVLSQVELRRLVKKGVLMYYYKSGLGKIAILTEDSETILGVI